MYVKIYGVIHALRFYFNFKKNERKKHKPNNGEELDK